jgi:hypothetical protein
MKVSKLIDDPHEVFLDDLPTFLHLDIAQENHSLSTNEAFLRTRLKHKVIALSVIEGARRKQCSRIANIKEGDANTKFFHLRVNARRKKNHIHRVKHNHGWVTEHAAKEEVVANHFNSILGARVGRAHDFNWEELNLSCLDLGCLAEPFSEAEVKGAIFQMPSDRDNILTYMNLDFSLEEVPMQEEREKRKIGGNF